MTNALIILIILAAFLLLISLIIWKSSLPENDKIMSLILILVVFSFVAILNESKRSQAIKTLPMLNMTNETQRISSKSFERGFYQLPETITLPLYKPKSVNFSEILDKEGYPRVVLLYNSGKSVKLQQFFIISMINKPKE